MKLPAGATTVIRFLGAITMLFGILSLLAMILILVINPWFGRRSYRLNHVLNNRIEEEAGTYSIGWDFNAQYEDKG